MGVGGGGGGGGGGGCLPIVDVQRRRHCQIVAVALGVIARVFRVVAGQVNAFELTRPDVGRGRNGEHGL